MVSNVEIVLRVTVGAIQFVPLDVTVTNWLAVAVDVCVTVVTALAVKLFVPVNVTGWIVVEVDVVTVETTDVDHLVLETHCTTLLV